MLIEKGHLHIYIYKCPSSITASLYNIAKDCISMQRYTFNTLWEACICKLLYEQNQWMWTGLPLKYDFTTVFMAVRTITAQSPNGLFYKNKRHRTELKAYSEEWWYVDLFAIKHTF